MKTKEEKLKEGLNTYPITVYFSERRDCYIGEFELAEEILIERANTPEEAFNAVLRRLKEKL